jgi:RimJ/RimL family protein N-acetyltransferase
MLLGDNLLLRKFVAGDAPRVAQLVGDIAVSRWTSHIPFPYTEQDAIDWIERSENIQDLHPYAVEMGSEIVACVSFWPHSDIAVEVGYWVGQDYWGRGVCTRALTGLMATVEFPASSDVVAKVMVGNTGSERVLLKCGFSFVEQCSIQRRGKDIEARFFVRRWEGR